jgi:hypothetical protein
MKKILFLAITGFLFSCGKFARETLEKDILAIVSEKPYKHSYED